MAGPNVAVIIEDDADIRGLISEILEQAGFTVHAAGTGAEGIALVEQHDPAITTLDISMPGMDGFETAKRIRAISATYIIMLTARADEIDTLQGLQSGADDYITKPFRPRELRARVEAMMRRPRVIASDLREDPAPDTDPTDPDASAADAGWMTHRGLRVHPEMHLAEADGTHLDLTRSEFDILTDLMGAGRRVVSKSDLALMLRGERYVGGSDFVSEHDVRAIEVHVANLRRKLGESATRPRWIETVRGVGYRMTAR
ncbi:response regulator transcription factor [Microbacterium sp. BK668]|uniref:response regulator transcription factor n=1 Tax=Microbacterium sp. BK668 TaxID=2512118 RepID=UPI001FB6CE20|nr:response regulator transcription factor [Microbacterium sp. BK668]